MSGIINYFKKDIKKLTVIALIVVVFVSGVIFIIGNTFAAGGYTIVFNRAEGNQVLKTCITDENGILDEDCITYIVGICHTWSEDIYNYNTQYNNYYYTDLETKVFTSNMNLYCKAATSVGNWANNIGCYVCIEDNSIMHWTTNGRADSKCPTYGYQRNYYISESECKTKLPDACYVCKDNDDVMKWDNDDAADSKCSSGYKKDTSITTESACKPAPDACYVCKDNEDVMKWDNDDAADSNCSGGYKKDSSITTESACKPAPDACYVCKDNEDVMKWNNDDSADSKCSSGYRKDSSITTESACRPAPDACYICNSDSNVMKWDNDDAADSNCSGGYTEDKSIAQNQCSTITNPQTGNMLFYILSFVGILSLAYSIYCYKFKCLKKS